LPVPTSTRNGDRFAAPRKPSNQTDRLDDAPTSMGDPDRHPKEEAMSETTSGLSRRNLLKGAAAGAATSLA
jgi:hypothetical protein